MWPLNTVQFSNHTQYGAWEGLPTPNEQISLLVDGIAARNALGKCDALLSGYLGSAEQGGHVLEAVAKVKAANPAALWCCDPVMGHPAKGCIVPEGVSDFFRDTAVAACDIICPNVLELGILAGGDPPTSAADCIAACHKLLAHTGSGGPSRVLVKHLAHAGLAPEQSFEMLLVSQAEALHIATPLLAFDRPPVGTGDLTSALFLVKLLQSLRDGTGSADRAALEHTASAYQAVMQTTHEAGEYELQLVASQDAIASPPHMFVAQSLLPDGTPA